MLNKDQEERCYDYMIHMFLSDTIELLDLVLFDDKADPHYSAVTTYNRLYAYLALTDETKERPTEERVRTFLQEAGYSGDDIRQFMEKKASEEPRFHGGILYETD